MSLPTAGLGGPASGLLTFGLGVTPVPDIVMPMAVPTTDRELLALVAEIGRSLDIFPYVKAYSRRPRADHTADDYPAFLVWPDSAEDGPQPSPQDSLRRLRFAVEIEVRKEDDAESGPEASDLAEQFRAAFNADPSFGGRCIGRMTWLSNAFFDETAFPSYVITWGGMLMYPTSRVS